MKLGHCHLCMEGHLKLGFVPLIIIIVQDCRRLFLSLKHVGIMKEGPLSPRVRSIRSSSRKNRFYKSRTRVAVVSDCPHHIMLRQGRINLRHRGDIKDRRRISGNLAGQGDTLINSSLTQLVLHRQIKR